MLAARPIDVRRAPSHVAAEWRAAPVAASPSRVAVVPVDAHAPSRVVRQLPPFVVSPSHVADDTQVDAHVGYPFLGLAARTDERVRRAFLSPAAVRDGVLVVGDPFHVADDAAVPQDGALAVAILFHDANDAPPFPANERDRVLYLGRVAPPQPLLVCVLLALPPYDVPVAAFLVRETPDYCRNGRPIDDPPSFYRVLRDHRYRMQLDGRVYVVPEDWVAVLPHLLNWKMPPDQVAVADSAFASADYAFG